METEIRRVPGRHFVISSPNGLLKHATELLRRWKQVERKLDEEVPEEILNRFNPCFPGTRSSTRTEEVTKCP